MTARPLSADGAYLRRLPGLVNNVFRRQIGARDHKKLPVRSGSQLLSSAGQVLLEHSSLGHRRPPASCLFGRDRVAIDRIGDEIVLEIVHGHRGQFRLCWNVCHRNEGGQLCDCRSGVEGNAARGSQGAAAVFDTMDIRPRAPI